MLSSTTGQNFVREALKGKYNLLSSPEDINNPEVGLVIVDHNILEQSCHGLLDKKQESDCLYLPVMVMMAKGLSGLDKMWELADDVVEMPVSARNFLTRVQGLLKIRAFSRQADLSQKKLMEKNEQLRLYFNAIDATISGLVITDPNAKDHPIIFCNKAFSELTGYTQEEIIGKNCRFLQGESRDQAGREIIREALAKGTDCNTLLRNYRKDGSMFWNELKISPIKNSGGKIEYFVGIQNDVTNLIETQDHLNIAKKQWQAIVGQNPNMIQISVDGIIQFMNTAGAELHGFKNPDDMAGLSVFSLHPEEEHSSLGERLKMVSSGTATPPRIYSSRDIDGNKRYIKVQSIPVDFEGKPSAQTIGEDVTQLKESEIELKNLLAQKQVLLQEVHHRVKNNLAVLSALISLQMSGLQNRESITALEDTQMRIISIAKVHELLYNQENLNEIRFDRYLEKIVQSLGESIEEEGSPPEFTLDVTPVNISLDQAITCGLLLNELITNSLKYAFSPGKQVRIAIKARVKGGRLYINYRDYGKGLDSDNDFFREGNFGSMIIQVLLNQLHAEWSLKSDGGFTFNLNFALAEYHGPSRYLARDNYEKKAIAQES